MRGVFFLLRVCAARFVERCFWLRACTRRVFFAAGAGRVVFFAAGARHVVFLLRVRVALFSVLLACGAFFFAAGIAARFFCFGCAVRFSLCCRCAACFFCCGCVAPFVLLPVPGAGRAWRLDAEAGGCVFSSGRGGA